MNDWWSRRLSGDSPRPTHSPSLPPVTPPLHNAIRIPAQPTSSQTQPSNTRVLDPSRAENENIPMGDAIRLWKGSRAMQRETMTCPDCGSDHVFSRTNGGTAVPPAPQCYTCGWNGRFTQGDQANWV